MQLLRDDRLRGFRIDIETDQLTESDQQADQVQAITFVKEVGGLLGEAMKLEQSPAAPALMPAVGETIMYAVRKFRAGRSLEEVFEQALGKAAWLMEQPKPPGPDEHKAQMQQASDAAKLKATEIKAQAEGQKAQIGAAAVQMKAQADMAKAELQAQHAAAEHSRNERMQQLEEHLALMDAHLRRQEHEMEMQKMQHEAALSARDREHEAALQQAQLAFGATPPAASPAPGLGLDAPFGA